MMRLRVLLFLLAALVALVAAECMATAACPLALFQALLHLDCLLNVLYSPCY